MHNYVVIDVQLPRVELCLKAQSTALLTMVVLVCWSKSFDDMSAPVRK